jgi:hypothetical protein
MMAADFLDAAVDFLPEETLEPIRFDEFTGDESAIGVVMVCDFPPFDIVGSVGFDQVPDGLVICNYPVPLPDLPSVGDCEPWLPEGWWDSWETEFTDTPGDEIESSDDDFTFEPESPWGGGVDIISLGPHDFKGSFEIEVDWANLEAYVEGYVPGVGRVPMTFHPGVGMVPDWPSNWGGRLPEPGEGSDFSEFDLVDELLADEGLAAESVAEPMTRSPRSAAFAEMGTMAAAAMAAQLQGNATDFTPPGSGRRRR